MNDQMFKDVICLILIGTVVVLSSLGHAIPPALQEWADTAFGFLFGVKSAGYVIGKDLSQPKPKESAFPTIPEGGAK